MTVSSSLDYPPRCALRSYSRLGTARRAHADTLKSGAVHCRGESRLEIRPAGRNKHASSLLPPHKPIDLCRFMRNGAAGDHAHAFDLAAEGEGGLVTLIEWFAGVVAAR